MKTITVQELEHLRQTNAPHVLIDVREAAEYQIGNLGALHIPVANADAQHEAFDADMPVIVHCRSGKRSADVILFLEQKYGYDKLYNLSGGIMAYAMDIDPTIQVL